jgi:hypothetical protein
MIMHQSVAAFLALVSLAACGLDAPLPVTSTKDFPCGIQGVVCPGKKCCSEGETCGTGTFPSVGCPAGECCFIGPNEAAAHRPDAGPILQAPEPRRRLGGPP